MIFASWKQKSFFEISLVSSYTVKKNLFQNSSQFGNYFTIPPQCATKHRRRKIKYFQWIIDEKKSKWKQRSVTNNPNSLYLFHIIVIFSVCLAILITIVSSQRPNLDCDAMVNASGKKYSEIYAPHEKNCQKFYQCTDHGLVELQCNRGLVFFPYINGCVEKTPDNCITFAQWKSLSN